ARYTILTLHVSFHRPAHPRSLHSFPTRRSSDLISASGVGPALALRILSGMSVEELVPAIRGGDLVRLTKIPGVGRKTAERIVVRSEEHTSELQSRFDLVCRLLLEKKKI